MDWQNFRVHRRLELTSKVEEIYQAIADIDGVKNSWQFAYRLLPQTIERLVRSVIVTSTASSNRMEGNLLTNMEVENLYKNLRVRKFKTRDEQEMAGYLQSLELVFNNYSEIPISESSILKLHHDMMSFTLFDPTLPHLVKKEMLELIDWYLFATSNQIKHPLILIANFIFEYLAIRPFQDGNGRPSRLLTNLMLLQHGYLFTRIVSHEKIIEANKIQYYLALNKIRDTWKTDQEDITTWLQFFLSILKEQSNQALKIIERNPIECLLSEKQLALWSWALNLDSTFSRKDAIKAFDFPKRTIESIIKKLFDLKCLEKLGQGQATRYKII